MSKNIEGSYGIKISTFRANQNVFFEQHRWIAPAIYLTKVPKLTNSIQLPALYSGTQLMTANNMF